jgi:hypothetical protein
MKTINAKNVKFTKVETGNRFAQFKKKGDTVIGRIVRSTINKGKFGKQKQWILQNGDSQITVGGAVIDSALSSLKKGTLVKIVLTGEKKSADSKNKYKIFDIFKGE